MTIERLGGLAPATIRATLLAAATAAAGETLPRFRTRLDVANKWRVGFDPVTEADRQAELAIRAVLAERFPEHSIIGEEWDAKATDSRFGWIVDPIDGTRAFIAGVPVWGTLIGFVVDGAPVAGLMAQPFTDELYLSLPGEAHYHHAGTVTALHTSGITDLAAAKLTTTSPDMFAPASGYSPQWEAIRSRVLTVRYGLDCYGYCQLAAGHLDLVVEAGLKNVDIAPLIPLIENAGGIVTDWAGNSAVAGGTCLAAATPELHRQALAVLQGA